MKYAVSLFGAITIIAAGCGIQDTGQVEKHPDDVMILLSEEQLFQSGIKAGKLELVPIQIHIECTGTVDVPPNHKAMIHTLVSTNVEEIKVLPGQQVKVGQILTILSHPNLIDLQQDFLTAKSRNEELKVELQRKQELIKSDITSKREYLRLKSETDRSTILVDALRQKLELIGISERNIEQYGITNEVEIKASISGVISEAFVTKGDFVEADEPLFRIVDPGHLHLELNVFSKDAALLEIGQVIDYRIPGSNQTYQGEVFLINPDVTPNNTVKIHGHLVGDNPEWKIGTFAQARIILKQELVPGIKNEEIIREGNNTFLFEALPNGFQKVQVKTGFSDHNYTEIIKTEESVDAQFVITGNYYLNGI